MARISPLPPHERVLWQGYPSWADHAVLFVFMAAALLRTALAFRSGEWLTAILYVGAIGVFFCIAAAFHYDVYYQIGTQRIRIQSGLWKSQTRDIPLDQVQSVTVKRELLNRWFGLGSLDITLREEMGDAIVLKGVPDPDAIKQHIDRLTGWPTRALSASTPR